MLGACSLPHAIVHFASSAEGEACVRQLDGSQMAGHRVRATLLPHSLSRIGLPAHSPPGAPPPQIAAQSPPLRLRTVALQNLLAPGERPDAQLAAEVREECETYGEVADVLVVDQWRDTGGAAALVRFQEPRAAAMAVRIMRTHPMRSLTHALLTHALLTGGGAGRATLRRKERACGAHPKPRRASSGLRLHAPPSMQLPAHPFNSRANRRTEDTLQLLESFALCGRPRHQWVITLDTASVTLL